MTWVCVKMCVFTVNKKETQLEGRRTCPPLTTHTHTIHELNVPRRRKKDEEEREKARSRGAIRLHLQRHLSADSLF